MPASTSEMVSLTREDYKLVHHHTVMSVASPSTMACFVPHKVANKEYDWCPNA